MSCDSKTACINTRGYYPPYGLSMEPEEEEPHEQEFDSPTVLMVKEGTSLVLV